MARRRPHPPEACHRGKHVVLLCEGDASLFATCSYVLMALQQQWPDCPCHVIPGISSVSAAAAAGLWPLALQQDQLLLRPCPESPAELTIELDEAKERGRVLALLKLGHRWEWVQPLLDERKLLGKALFAEKVGWPRPADPICRHRCCKPAALLFPAVDSSGLA